MSSDLRAVADAISALGPVGRLTVACYLVILVAVVVDLAATGLHRGPLPRARVVSLLVTISVALVLAPPFAWIVAQVWSSLGALAPPSLVHVWRASRQPRGSSASWSWTRSRTCTTGWVITPRRLGIASGASPRRDIRHDPGAPAAVDPRPRVGDPPVDRARRIPVRDGGSLLFDLDRIPGAATHEPELERRTVGRSAGVGTSAPTAPCRRQRAR